MTAQAPRADSMDRCTDEQLVALVKDHDCFVFDLDGGHARLAPCLLFIAKPAAWLTAYADIRNHLEGLYCLDGCQGGSGMAAVPGESTFPPAAAAPLDGAKQQHLHCMMLPAPG